MKVNYVLMYGTPFFKYREFETFEDISKFLINKSITHYIIFEKMSDEKEVEMIYLNSDIRVLEDRINKAIEYIDNHFLYHYGSEKRPIVFEDNYIQEIVDILRGENNE